ncbi:hypothetical protein VPH35_083498 [Triticum aestivum]
MSHMRHHRRPPPTSPAPKESLFLKNIPPTPSLAMVSWLSPERQTLLPVRWIPDFQTKRGTEVTETTSKKKEVAEILQLFPFLHASGGQIIKHHVLPDYIPHVQRFESICVTSSLKVHKISVV